MKSVKAWAVVHDGVLVKEFDNRRFDIYERRAEAEKVAKLAVIPTTEQAYVVRVEIRELPKRKARK